MSLFVHALRGCAPTPLAHYLKALGVLRLVASQADEGARGFWRDGVFFLATKLDEDGLVRFFLERYEPTPMLSPWNAGSGFYFREEKLAEVDQETGKQKKSGMRDQPTKATKALEALHASTDPRLDRFRDALGFTRELVKLHGFVAAPKAKDGKEELLARVRNIAPASLLGWIEAAFVVQDGKENVGYPALLGSGGNEGNLDYSNNFIQYVMSAIAFDEATTNREAGARSMLFGSISATACAGSSGQFSPGATAGANATSGFDGESLVNAWDFLLMLEGALLFRVASLRRLDSDDLAGAAAPFAMNSQGTGYGSASTKDASSRGEQWAPLWTGAASLAEVEALFDEGRLQAAHGTARKTMDATRAIANLGAARGVETFVRFGYFERNGDKSNFAVPLGVLHVKHRPEVRLLDELDPFVRSMSFAAQQKGAPLSLARASRTLERAMFAASLPTATRETWGELIGVLGDVEHGFLRHAKSAMEARLRPLPLLSPRWLERIDDGTTEARLAVAIASQGDRALGPLRTNTLPLEPPHYQRFRTTADALARDPSVVWRGHSVVADLTAVALRRVVDGSRLGLGGLPLFPRRTASLADVQAFLEGRVDEGWLGRLVRGLLALDWARVDDAPNMGGEPTPLHALVRLGYLPHVVLPLHPRLDATPLRLLASGRLADAGRLLVQRLAGAGLRPKLGVIAGDAALARRLAASVAIPISRRDYERLLGRLAKPFTLETAP